MPVKLFTFSVFCLTGLHGTPALDESSEDFKKWEHLKLHFELCKAKQTLMCLLESLFIGLLLSESYIQIDEFF